MQLAKYAIVAVIAVACGVTSGAFMVHRQLDPQLASIAQERDQLSKTLSDTAKEATSASERLTSLERRNGTLEEDINRLRERVDATAAQEAMDAQTESVDAPDVDIESAESGSVDAAQAERRDRDDRGDRGRWGEDMTPEEREQRGAEFRQRIDDFMNEQIANAPTAEAQQRLAAINDYAQYSMDLFRQMRDAETDEERDAIRSELEQIRDTTRGLVQDQQDFLLRESLKANGITSTSQQDALMSTLRTTMEDPMFRMPMGGGGPGGPGGPWGWRGRGGGDQNQQGGQAN